MLASSSLQCGDGEERNAGGEEELSRRGGGERSGLLFNKTRPTH